MRKLLMACNGKVQYQSNHITINLTLALKLEKNEDTGLL